MRSEADPTVITQMGTLAAVVGTANDHALVLGRLVRAADGAATVDTRFREAVFARVPALEARYADQTGDPPAVGPAQVERPRMMYRAADAQPTVRLNAVVKVRFEDAPVTVQGVTRQVTSVQRSTRAISVAVAKMRAWRDARSRLLLSDLALSMETFVNNVGVRLAPEQRVSMLRTMQWTYVSCRAGLTWDGGDMSFALELWTDVENPATALNWAAWRVWTLYDYPRRPTADTVAFLRVFEGCFGDQPIPWGDQLCPLQCMLLSSVNLTVRGDDATFWGEPILAVWGGRRSAADVAQLRDWMTIRAGGGVGGTRRLTAAQMLATLGHDEGVYDTASHTLTVGELGAGNHRGDGPLFRVLGRWATGFGFQTFRLSASPIIPVITEFKRLRGRIRLTGYQNMNTTLRWELVLSDTTPVTLDTPFNANMVAVQSLAGGVLTFFPAVSQAVALSDERQFDVTDVAVPSGFALWLVVTVDQSDQILTIEVEANSEAYMPLPVMSEGGGAGTEVTIVGVSPGVEIGVAGGVSVAGTVDVNLVDVGAGFAHSVPVSIENVASEVGNDLPVRTQSGFPISVVFDAIPDVNANVSFPGVQDVRLTSGGHVSQNVVITGPLPLPTTGGGGGPTAQVEIVGIRPLTTPLWTSAVASPTPPIVPPSEGAGSMEALSRNRMMHALNGNIIFDPEWDCLVKAVLENENYFQPLVALEENEYGVYEIDPIVEPLRPPPRPPKPKPEGARAKAPPPPPVAPEPKAPPAKDMVRQREAVVRRLSAKLKAMAGDRAGAALAAWAATGVESGLVYDLSLDLWGRDWVCSNRAVRWYVQYKLLCSYALDRDVAEERRLVLEAAMVWGAGVVPTEDEVWEFINAEGLDEALATSDGDLAARAARHNAEMHALNGNILFSADLAALFAGIDAFLFVNTGTGAGVFESASMDTQVYSLSTTATANRGAQTAIEMLRCTLQRANNAQEQVADVCDHEIMFPRNMRNGGAWVDFPGGLPASEVTLATLFGRVLTPSTEAVEALTANARGQALLPIQRAVTWGGWDATDAMTTSKIDSVYGIDTTSMVVKVVGMLHFAHLAQPKAVNSFASWGTNRVGMQVEDALIPGGAAPVRMARGYGTNEDWQSAAGQSEFGVVVPNNNRGTIAFHLSLATVPMARRQSAYVVPAGMITNDESQGGMIALLAASVAPYPCAPFGAQYSAQPIAGGAPIAGGLVRANASTVMIDGQPILDFVLPRRAAVVTPNAQAEANAAALLQPAFGSIGEAPYAADQVMNINFVGGPYIEYNLCAYLCSWLETWTPAFITKWLFTLHNLVDCSQELAYAREWWSVMTTRYRPLVVAPRAPGAARPVFAQDGVYAPQTTYYNARNVPKVPIGNWPLAALDDVVTELPFVNPIAWNQLAYGLATVVRSGLAAAVVGASAMPAWLMDPLFLTRQAGLARALAAAWTTMASMLGFEVDMYNAAFGLSLARQASSTIRGLYYGAGSASGFSPGDTSAMLVGAFEAYTGKRLTTSRFGLNAATLFRIPTAVQATRGFFRAGAGGAGDVEITAVCPTTLRDSEVRYFAVDLPARMRSPPPNFLLTSLSGKPAPGSSIQINAPGHLSAPISSVLQGGIFDQDSTVDAPDVDYLSMRMMSTLIDTAVVETFAGVAMQSVAGNELVTRLPGYTWVVRPVTLALSCQSWIPTATGGCDILQLYAPPGDVIAISARLNGQQMAQVDVLLVANMVGGTPLVLSSGHGTSRYKAVQQKSTTPSQIAVRNDGGGRSATGGTAPPGGETGGQPPHGQLPA
jgi:hypothetical protein